MMTIRQEKELEAKGYRLESGFDSQTDAKAYAEELRAKGYRARVATYSTMIRGLHEYGVWYKFPETK